MTIYDFSDMKIDPRKHPWGYSYKWTPGEIGTALWLDAADADTITLDSYGRVDKWNDKSGNNYHGNQGTASKRPSLQENAVGSYSAVRFVGSDSQLLGFGDVLDIEDLPMISFVVARNNGADGTIFGKVNTNRDAGRWAIRYRDDGALKGFRFWLQGDNNTNHSVDIYGYDTQDFNIISQVIDRARHKAFLNAIELFDNAAEINNNLSINEPFEIGSYGYGFDEYLTGDICEVVILRRIPSEVEFQKIEGYLAHKWALAANLPSGHPYKVNAP